MIMVETILQMSFRITLQKMGLNHIPPVHIPRSIMVLQNVRIDTCWRSLGRTLLFEMNLPKPFWSDGVLTAT